MESIAASARRGRRGGKRAVDDAAVLHVRRQKRERQAAASRQVTLSLPASGPSTGVIRA